MTDAGATRRVRWRGGKTACTAVAYRQGGRSELQYVRRVRVTQREPPRRETEFAPVDLPAWVARELGVEGGQ